MPIVFDSVLAAALARELEVRWAGRRLEAVRFDREPRRVRLEFGDGTWIWLLHPRDGVLVRLGDEEERPQSGPGGRGGPGPRGRARRGEGRRAGHGRGILEGPRRVVSVGSPADTRRIVLRLEGPEDGDERLVFDLVTNRWNALHVVGGRVRSVLVPDLGREPVSPGDEWDPAPSGRRWAEAPPDPAEWREALAGLNAPDGRGARARIAWLSGMNEAYVLDAGSAESLARYVSLRDAARSEDPDGWLLPETGAVPGSEAGVRPYVRSLGVAGAEHAGSLLDAFEAVARRSSRVTHALREAAEPTETTRLREALEHRRERLEKKIRALEAEVGERRDPEELRGLGHLLLARKREIPAGATEVRLDDFSGEEITVPLDPALDAVENAEAFYERARRVERAAAELPRRIRSAGRRLARLEDSLARLRDAGPDEAAWKLAGGRERVLGRGAGGRSSPGGGEAESLPYRIYRTSSGREVRAGRSARANDELTFHHSAPDDIWMHVREAPGSHVVLRWGERDQNPPESDIAEAAIVAAVLSRARGSSMVPVAWTRRKYVRKPRKAPPGTVVPERTQTVFVRPDERRVRSMAEEG